MAETIIYILFTLPSLAIIAVAVILNVKGKFSTRLRWWMSVMLVVVALSMLCYAQYYNVHLTSRYSWGFDFLYCLITPFCAPLYYLFINSLANIKKRPAIDVMCFYPAIIYAVLLITGQMLMNSDERHAFICNEILGQNIQMEPSVAYEWMLLVGKKLFAVFMPVQAIAVMIYGEIRLNAYIRMLHEYSSVNETGNTIKMREIHVLTVLIVVTGLIMSVIPMNDAVDHIWLVLIAVIGQIVMVSLIAKYIMRLEFSAEDIQTMIQSPSINGGVNIGGGPAVKPSIRIEKPKTLIERIDAAMETGRLYLQPDLSLVSLSEQIGTNRTYASKAIKDAKGCNFSDYVNRYRLDYALAVMKNTPKDKIVIQNIATQCGCGSIQTFYRYFKIFYNETPSQWIERNK